MNQPEDAAAVLELDHLSLSFGGLRAISELDLRIGDREVVSVIGPNGAGKTTVFNVMRRQDPAEIHLAKTCVRFKSPGRGRATDYGAAMSENLTPQENPAKDPKDWVTGAVTARRAASCGRREITWRADGYAFVVCTVTVSAGRQLASAAELTGIAAGLRS